MIISIRIFNLTQCWSEKRKGYRHLLNSLDKYTERPLTQALFREIFRTRLVKRRSALASLPRLERLPGKVNDAGRGETSVATPMILLEDECFG